MSLNSPIPSAVSVALGRCRHPVIVCCWLIGLALATQMFLWSLATFTELRFEPAEKPDDAPMIVHAEPETSTASGETRARERRAVPRPEATTAPSEKSAETDHAPAERVFSRTDRRFASTFNLAAGVGQCAMFVLLAVIGLTVMLAAASGLSSIDRTVSSFLWLLLVALLILPMGNLFSLPWQHGALTTYEHMTAAVDLRHEQRQIRMTGQESEAGQTQFSALEFYIRFGLLPATCIVGIALVGLRYCSSLEGALPQRERMRLDPTLEREAANITPTSLHGGRSGSVFSRAIGGEGEHVASNEKTAPNARSVSPGDQPKRLI